MADAWSPEKYLQFKNERSLPFFELMDLVQPASFRRVVDLGCGTGELTKILHEKFQPEETLGIDNSQSMLSEAEKIKEPGLTFRLHDIEDSFENSQWDLLFSNAALQWCDEHPELFCKIAPCILPGGQMAIQMPANHDYPTHEIASKLAQENPFRDALEGKDREYSVLDVQDYSELLYRLGFKEQKVFLKVFVHLLPGRENVIDWVKGTLLTYYQARLSQELFEKFVIEFRKRLFRELLDEHPFFYPFKRIFIWARK